MKVMYNCFFSSLFLGEGSVDLEIFLFYISLRFAEKRWIRLIFCVRNTASPLVNDIRS